jgi:hypothetical protein
MASLIFRYNFLLIILSITILRIPSLYIFSENMLVAIVCLIPFWIAIIGNILVKKRIILKKQNLIIIIYILLILFAFIISFVLQVVDSTFILGKFVFFFSCIFFSITTFWGNSEKNQSFYYLAIYFSIFTFILFNCILLLLGFQRFEEDGKNLVGVAKTLSYLGIIVPRTLFPLSSGMNFFASFCLVLGVWSIILLKDNRKVYQIIFFYIGLVLSIVCILLADTRTTLALFFVIAFLIVFNFNKIIIKINRYKIPTSILFSIISVLLWVSDNKLKELVGRDGEINSNDMLRLIVWSSTYLKIIDSNIFNILFGYGFAGNETTQLSEEISILLNIDAKPTSHNFFLQVIIDMGLFGCLVTYLLLRQISKKVIILTKTNKNYLALSLSITVLIISGSSEAVPTFYSIENYILFLFIIFFISGYNT